MWLHCCSLPCDVYHCCLLTPKVVIKIGQYWFRWWLVPYGTNPLPELRLATRHWDLVAFTRGKHYDVMKWKYFPRYCPFVRGIHRSPVNSPHKGQWRGALMFSLICAWINGWINNREAGDLRRHRSHYDVTVVNLPWNAQDIDPWYEFEK